LLSTSSVGEIVDYKGLLGSKVGWVPALRWIPAYATRRFGLDLIAGLSLAAFVIPESLAYASLAQLPPVNGLYCYLVAGIVYGFFAEGATGNFFARVAHVAVSLPEAHVPSLLFGLVAIALFVVFNARLH
jgi:sulfate permease, SulP family